MSITHSIAVSTPSREDQADIAAAQFEPWVTATVNYWKSRKDSMDVERLVSDFLADPYEFAQLAIMAHLEGKGAEFLESQLRAFAACEVNDEA